MNTTAVTHQAALTAPADFPRRILLAVSGLTPQIVTETLGPAFDAHRIHYGS